MSHLVRFDCFEADLDVGQLRKRGIKIQLRDQPFLVLTSLLEHAGQLVTRDDLRQRLWRDEVFVDFDNSLNIAIARLRAALGDSADHPRYIETLPKRGYRFIGNVSCAEETRPVERLRLVVLPFVNLSIDPAQEYFSDAMTDAVITALASLAPERLAVIARTTAMHYKGAHKDVTRIGHELAVDYVVEGSVWRESDHTAINVQLIQTSDQANLFATRYEAELRDIFNMQNSIAQGIAAHIPTIAGNPGIQAVRGRIRKPTEDLAAYNEYIQARYLMGKSTAQGLAAIKVHLEKAIACDSEFALAYDALAEVYWELGYWGFMRPREAFDIGIVQALRAIEIDNTRAETHALLGQFHKTVGYNWSEVHREMALALRLDPVSPVVRMRYAWNWLMPQGRMQEAVEEMEYALHLDPLSLIVRLIRVTMLLISYQHERTLEAARQLLELDPSAYWAYLAIGSTYRDQRRFGDAIAAYRKAVEVSGDSAPMLGWLGHTLGLNGNTSEARALLQRLYRKAEEGYVPTTSFAWVHLGLGEIDAAFEWLNRAVEECDQLLMPIKSYRFLDPIRSDPRFTALLRKMNLESGPNESSREGPEFRNALKSTPAILA